jgi:hypothetical protein
MTSAVDRVAGAPNPLVCEVPGEYQMNPDRVLREMR